jgi:hypothetical protein
MRRVRPWVKSQNFAGGRRKMSYAVSKIATMDAGVSLFFDHRSRHGPQAQRWARHLAQLASPPM